MKKILIVAAREYKAVVGTKAFALSLVLMPLMMFGGLLAMKFLGKAQGIETKRVVVFDESGAFYDQLKVSADQMNAMLRKAADEVDTKPEDSKSPFGQVAIEVERLEGDSLDNKARLAQCDRIRDGEIGGFLELPAGLAELAPSEAPVSALYYGQDALISEVRIWAQRSLSAIMQTRRLTASGIDPTVVAIASRPVDVSSQPLLTAKSVEDLPSDQSDVAAMAKGRSIQDELAGMFAPMVAMLFMFMVIFLAAQPMLESVIEEKSLRIAEVMLGSVNPLQFMAGKLIGCLGGSLTIFFIYMIGFVAMAERNGWLQYVPVGVIPWFVIYQVLGVVFFASIFLAVGASVSQLKEAQSMLLPVWLTMMLPMFTWIFIVRQPNGSMATWMSFFPPSTAGVMVLRLATGVNIPVWQVALSIVLLAVSAFLMVGVSGRIFRAGILWQGKTPKLIEIVRWGLTGR